MPWYFYGCILKMPKYSFFPTSLNQLLEITSRSHNDHIRPVADSIWRKHLDPENPLWKYVEARSFTAAAKNHQAHVLAMTDRRLPGIGLVGFFGCTDISGGAEVLNQACKWLYSRKGIKKIYGPINGTITRDYRFNLKDDYRIPGEPVNPVWYIDAFKQAGFDVFNRYVSGISRHYQIFTKPFIRRPSDEYSHLKLRAFDVTHQLEDLKTYHDLMNIIFLPQSIYCPEISFEERVFNMAGSKPIFDPEYSYFLDDDGGAIGFIIAFPYEGRLVVKTLGLLPEYRGKRLAGLLIKKVHDQADKDGLKAAVYSTIREGNAAYRMKRPGVRIYRRYVTMCKSMPV